MKSRLIKTALIAAMAMGTTIVANAADPVELQTQDRDRIQDQVRDQDQDGKMYGSQLMSKQERMEYRKRMQAAKSGEEREQIRAEHHKRMQQRAQEKGVKIPDEPPMHGAGKGMGAGGGMGQGGQRR